MIGIFEESYNLKEKLVPPRGNPNLVAMQENDVENHAGLDTNIGLIFQESSTEGSCPSVNNFDNFQEFSSVDSIPWSDFEESTISEVMYLDSLLYEEEELDSSSSRISPEFEQLRYRRSSSLTTTELQQLTTRTFQLQESAYGGSNEEPKVCVICLSEYQKAEKLGILECGHEYHASCIKKWLLKKNVCPICKRIAIQKKEMTGVS